MQCLQDFRVIQNEVRLQGSLDGTLWQNAPSDPSLVKSSAAIQFISLDCRFLDGADAVDALFGKSEHFGEFVIAECGFFARTL